MTPADQKLAFRTPADGQHPEAADLTVYAMQLVSGDQARAMADHLASCPDCRDELGRIQDDLVLTALTVDLNTPSASVRQRFLSQVAREKKVLAPIPAEQLRTRPISPSSFGRSNSMLSSDSEQRKPKRRVGLVVLTVVGWAAAAGLCLFSGSLIRQRQNLRSDLGAQAGEINRLTADAAQAHELMDALTNPGAMRVAMRVPATPKPQAIASGGVTYNPDRGSLVFLASNMPPLEQYKAYELWIIPADNSAAIPAGTFHPDMQGNGAIIMPDLPKGIAAKAFGVTIEPEGGSQSPTMPLLMFGN